MGWGEIGSDLQRLFEVVDPLLYLTKVVINIAHQHPKPGVFRTGIECALIGF